MSHALSPQNNGSEPKAVATSNNSDRTTDEIIAGFLAAKDCADLKQLGIPLSAVQPIVRELIALKNQWITQRHRQLSISEIRKRSPNAYKTWTLAQVERLDHMNKNGYSRDEIAAELGRQPGAITVKLNEIARWKGWRPLLGCGGGSPNCRLFTGKQVT